MDDHRLAPQVQELLGDGRTHPGSRPSGYDDGGFQHAEISGKIRIPPQFGPSLYLASVIRFAVLAAFFSLLSCSRQEKREQQVFALKEMSDLATVEYTVTKIIKASDDQTWYKVGDRKILMSCRATLKAGIDFSRLDRKNIRTNGDEINVTLPKAKLLSVNIRPEDIRVEYEDIGLLRSDFTSAERDQLAAQGESQIRAGMGELGILATAESNAALFTGNFLRQLGYRKVQVQFEDGLPPGKLN
jgi:hypothetical protein